MKPKHITLTLVEYSDSILKGPIRYYKGNNSQSVSKENVDLCFALKKRREPTTYITNLIAFVIKITLSNDYEGFLEIIQGIYNQALKLSVFLSIYLDIYIYIYAYSREVKRAFSPLRLLWGVIVPMGACSKWFGNIAHLSS